MQCDLGRAIGRILSYHIPYNSKKLAEIHYPQTKKNDEYGFVEYKSVHIISCYTLLRVLLNFSSCNLLFRFLGSNVECCRILDRIRWLLVATPHSFHGAHNAWPKNNIQVSDGTHVISSVWETTNYPYSNQRGKSKEGQFFLKCEFRRNFFF